MTTDLYYRRSGRFSLVAGLTIVALTAAVAIVLGAIYGVAVAYCPIVYVNILLTAGLGLAVGWVVFKLAVQMHVRNLLVAVVIAVFGGLVADYAAFVSWILKLSDWQALILAPTDLLRVMAMLAETGVWSLSRSGELVNGWFLYSVWLIEAAIILGVAAVLPLGKLGLMAYCESCRQWVSDHLLLSPFEPIDEATARAIRARLEQGEFAALGDITPKQDEGDAFTVLDLAQCSHCDQLHLLTIRSIRIEYDKNGKAEAKETPVVQNMLIDAASRALIEQLAPQPDAAAAPETDETPPGRPA